MRQWALKKDGKLIPGRVTSKPAQCWRLAMYDSMFAPSRILSRYRVEKLRIMDSGYSVVPVEVVEVKEIE